MVVPYTPSSNSLEVYSTRYLDDEAKTPDDLWRRVSNGNDVYYRLMKEGLFLPNSPTLFNMGTDNGGTLSACFVFDLEDALLGDWPDGGLDQPFATSIAGTAFKAMAVAKAGGGVGYYLGNLRRKNADVRSTHKKACGPVTVLRWLNTLNWLITQGGKRALAQMGVLPCWHPDIREFIHCKDENPHELSSFNISVSWLNEWLEKIEWDVINQGQGYIDRGRDETKLWWEQCSSAWKTGCPGMFFWTLVNLMNPTPHLGNINAPNPCGETPNVNDEPCNLGSSVLKRFLKKVGNKYVFMWDEFKERIREMLRFLDDILDWNIFPHPDITKMALSTRKLGLGTMGYAATLNMMGIPYDSQEAVDFGSEVAKVTKEETHDESVKLADLKGPYPAWEIGSPETKAKFPRRRNATTTSIAPTGTIYLLADAETSSIEPPFALETERTTGEGLKLVERLDSIRETGNIPKLANQIAYEWHVRHQAAFQKHTDLGVSKTINMPKNATVMDFSNAYKMMWQLECKGGTIYRDQCRPEQVLRDTKSTPKSVYLQVPESVPIPQHVESNGRRKLPRERDARIIKFNVFGTEGYLIPGFYEDGQLGEIFVEMKNDGSTLSGIIKAFAKQVSLSLQYHTPLQSTIALHKNSVFEPRGFTGDPDVPSCSSIPDYFVRKLEHMFVAPVPITDVTEENVHELNIGGTGLTGLFCPTCGTELIRQGSSCLMCTKSGCGYSKC